tara:strand:+ start:8544 stop:8864 length:321 start_codon:yes stop_codon:yes gene_type:complete
MTTYGQISKDLRGVWKSNESSFYVMVTGNENSGLNFNNVSWVSNIVLKETVLKVTDTSVTTRIENLKTDWKVRVVYTQINKNTIKCEFTGSTNQTNIYKRYYLLTN